MMKWRVFLFAILLAVAGTGLYLTLFHRPETGPKIGAGAPDFTLPGRDGKPVSLASFRGRPVLLNFWATWCGPCQQEMPSLEALYQRYKDRGFVILGVSLDEEGWPVVEDFLKRVPVDFPLLLDSAQAVSDAYQIYRIPETYLIDAEGKIVDKFVGPQDYNQEIFYKKVERTLSSPDL
ncbi:MAG TPA: TlpA disulfide reductase family protein [bacterium]|nr:TlpA disulfide reductase family protein [bacterium]